MAKRTLQSHKAAYDFFLETFEPEREKIIKILTSLQNEIQREAEIEKIGYITYSALGIVGGGMVIGGMIFAPISAGASLGLTVVGVSAGVSSSVADIAHGTIKAKIVQKKLNKAQRKLREHEDICLKMAEVLCPLKRDIELIQKRIDDIKQAKKDGDQNVKLIQFATGVTTILANSKPTSVQKLLSNGEELCKIIKLGKAIDELMPAAVRDASKEIARSLSKESTKGVSKMVTKETATLSTKLVMGTVTATAILVDLGFLISDAIDLHDFCDGNLCSEAENLRCVIKQIQKEKDDLKNALHIKVSSV